MADDAVTSAIREVLSVIPAGCSWLLPVTDDDGEVTDFAIAAASGSGHDVYRRGTDRVDSRIGEIYPSIVGGQLWRLYLKVLRTGEPAELREFRYEEKRAGVVPRSLFDVTVHPVLGGLLVWWQRLDEDRRRIERTEQLGNLGWAEYDLVTGESQWSPGMYRLFERDPELGPMSQAQQAAAIDPDDRGLAEAAWLTMESGGVSDITVRFRIGSTVKHTRILSDVVSDAEGAPLKVHAVVQDVTVREQTRDAIERLSDQLRTRELTALAEHRLAAQLQHMIQPVPAAPLTLPGLEVMVGYLPAESAIRVGGDWYHAQDLADGRTVLAVGDVAGHGLSAASSMAHLRFALIAWLAIGIDDPATLLGHLNRLCGRLRVTGTAVIAVYDPASRALSWARAGHAAPLLARDGTAMPLELPTGLLLGADDEATYEILTPCLAADDLLLLYTDGLVERRVPGIPSLLSDVMKALAAASAEPPGQALRGLAPALNRPSPDDDTCTVAVRVL
ncbi:PP2C family protein-serine/threonine phosphatase [Paractinoplanes globisporus]|uniref:PP2C family protein-serine/threonine phosphatase n=1 Tax=Paractinoplanes globisporus TaxID=113565 RepID=A0ABW6WBV6_9ACTN|nr:PP2C family protein-serine/threonine phosphatase [Actinoplanes globisporus]